LRHHRELGEGRLLGGWVCCLKLLGLGLLLLLLVKRARGLLGRWRLLLGRLLRRRRRRLLEEELRLVLGRGLGRSGQSLDGSGRRLLWGGWSLGLLGLRLG